MCYVRKINLLSRVGAVQNKNRGKTIPRTRWRPLKDMSNRKNELSLNTEDEPPPYS